MIYVKHWLDKTIASKENYFILILGYHRLGYVIIVLNEPMERKKKRRKRIIYGNRFMSIWNVVKGRN